MKLPSNSPLNLDFLQGVKFDGESPELEIVKQDFKCSSSAQDGPREECVSPLETNEFAEWTDSDILEKIEGHKGYLKGQLKLPDGGYKIKRKLERLEKEKARRQLEDKKIKGGIGQGLQKAAGKSSALLVNQKASSVCKMQSTKQTGCQVGVLQASKTLPGAFSVELGVMKGRPHSDVAECKGPQRKQDLNRHDQASPHGQRNHRVFDHIHSSRTCAVSKFYSQADRCGDQVGHSWEPQLEKSKDSFCCLCKKPIFRKVSSRDNADENELLCAHCQNKEDGLLGIFTSPVNLKGQPLNSFMKESMKGQLLGQSQRESSGSRASSGKRRHVASIGLSPDTAMELSDDEENEQVKDADSQACKNSNMKRRGLRSALGWKEGLSIAYPRGDTEAVEVRQSDLKHLAPFEFLNDTVIDFYIKYIQRPENLSDERKTIFHFFNSFFFKKLLLGKKKMKGIDYFSKLRKWTKGVNIFEKMYLLMPIHDSAHWSLAIICFPREKEQTHVVKPYILHLDSMSGGHVSEHIFKVLKSYLEAEWNCMSQDNGSAESSQVVPANSVLKRVEVPLQENDWDCGLFLLFFIERFVEDAPPEFKPSALGNLFGRNWFKPDDASNLRAFIRKLLESLFDEVTVLEVVMEDVD